MFKRHIDRALKPVAHRLQHGPMEKLGIRRTMRLARSYNRWLYGHHHAYRVDLYTHRMQELLDGNGAPAGAPLTMQDGWVLDTSGTLPHLDVLLDDAERLIAERGGKEEPDERYRAFFRNLITVSDLATYPSFLDFVLSSDLLATVCSYLGFIPCLSKTLPPGVRFAESSKAMDANAHLPPRDSQLFHIDPYDSPMVYVIVLLRDVTPECGPFTWISETLSQQAARSLNYWSKGKPYRLSDEEVYSVVDPDEAHVLTYPRGTVLFIDPSRCLHYGSREAIVPRYQMMYGFVSPCRSDFSETLLASFPYPSTPADSHLRRLVLDKTYRL